MTSELETGIVILYRGTESVRQLNSLLEKFAQTNKKVHLIVKNVSPEFIKERKHLAKSQNYTLHHFSDDGLDWGAYIRISNIIKEKLIIFMNANTRVVEPDFDVMLRSHLLKCENPYRSVCGASGSYETLKPTLEDLVSKKLSLLGKILYLYRFLKTRRIMLNSTSFPNPHVRSNVFILHREFFIKYCSSISFPKNKYDCYELENGKDSLSAYALKNGGDIRLVNADNCSFSFSAWHEAKVYRNTGKDRSLAYDNQHVNFWKSSWLLKKILMIYAWGHSNN